MGSTEAEERHAAFDVGPEVVCVGDVKLALVLGGVAVGVTNERGLEVVVEVGVAGNLLATFLKKGRLQCLYLTVM